ncbi:MAG: hypothetical protein ATN36_05825 [Epulopiscium sp. Nele67-Bin005]|nr:MAG: hypothetical protein ATN36_05825 [Epulopiscium sp. Nele67-Bin005]
MKKIALMALGIGILTFTGCSNEEIEFWNKLEETAKWEAVQVDQLGTIKLNLLGDELNLNFSSKSYMLQNELQGVTDITMQLSTSIYGEETEILEPIDLKIYLIDGQYYMSKSYFEQAFLFYGYELNSNFHNIEADYILMQYDENTQFEMSQMLEILLTETYVEEFYDFYEIFFKDLNLEGSLTKLDNTYSLELDTDQTVNLFFNIFDLWIDNLDDLNENYNLDNDPDEIFILQQQLTDIKNIFQNDITNLIYLLMAEINGTCTFEDNSINQTIDATFGVKLLSELNILVDTQIIEAEIMPIDFDEDFAILTPDDLYELLVINEFSINVPESNILLVDEEQYVPIAVLVGLSPDVEFNLYDTNYKVMDLSFEGVYVRDIPIILQNDELYMPAEVISKLGIEVIENNNSLEFLFK